jgi:hypothetical protein
MVSKLKLYIRQGTDNQNIQGAQQLNSPRLSESMRKWAYELNSAFSKEEVKMTKKHKAHHPWP